jgi:hypothetical protein
MFSRWSGGVSAPFVPTAAAVIIATYHFFLLLIAESKFRLVGGTN